MNELPINIQQKIFLKLILLLFRNNTVYKTPMLLNKVTEILFIIINC